jgi:hypothetical protein
MPKSLVLALAAAGLAVSAGAGAPALATAGQAGHHQHGASQRFVMSYATVNGKDSPAEVVAAGPIHGTGTLVDTPLRQTRHGVVLRSVLTLPDGTVTLRAREKYVVSMNRRSCTATNIGRGTWRVVSGTGAYGHATGRGTFVRRTFIVGAFGSNGQCLGRSAVPAAETGTLVITGKAAR